ncbi:methyltransferase domain-containing protein [bacterium]|nr:methyltransferase domain-containing protein [bacterium]
MLKDIDLNHKNILVSGISKGNTIPILMDYLVHKKMFFKVTIIDIEAQSIKKLKEQMKCPRESCTLYTADIGDIGFLKDESFDIIVLSSILSSINERPFKALKALTEVRRVLKRNGTLYIKEKISTIGNKRKEYLFYNWYRSRKYALEALSKNISHAKTHFYLDDLKFAVKNMGFKIIDQKWLNDESITKEKKKVHLNELSEYENIIQEYSGIFKMIAVEYENLKVHAAIYPPNIVLTCTLI